MCTEIFNKYYCPLRDRPRDTLHSSRLLELARKLSRFASWKRNRTYLRCREICRCEFSVWEGPIRGIVKEEDVWWRWDKTSSVKKGAMEILQCSWYGFLLPDRKCVHIARRSVRENEYSVARGSIDEFDRIQRCPSKGSLHLNVAKCPMTSRDVHDLHCRSVRKLSLRN